jgi:hypothetical protein
MRPFRALAGGMVATAVLASAAAAQTIGKPTFFDVNLQDNSHPATGVQVEKPLNGEDRDHAIVRKLNDWGVAEGEKSFDNKQGRWYLFAAASGRSVGLNMVGDGAGHYANAGVTTDQTATVGTGEAGIGWRKGDRQISLGFEERRLQGASDWVEQTMPRSDHGVGLTYSLKLKPRR